MKTVAVFFGGRSSEREISVITGVYAVNLLRGAGYRVLPVYLTEDDVMTLCEELRSVEEVTDFNPKKFLPVCLVRGGISPIHKLKKSIPVDCALNCCHGGMGEGGGLAALIAFNRIVSASPAMPESAVFLDKTLSKLVLKGLNIPVAPYFVLREREFKTENALERIESALEYPVIVKPSVLGSSVGISVAHDRGQLKAALKRCFKLDNTALIEKYLEGKRDLNIAAYRLGEEIVISPVEEVFSGNAILSFAEKYEDVGRRASKLPAEIPQEIAKKAEEYLKEVYEAFGIQGIVRADFLLCGEELYFNELNTIPGTLATYLFGESLSAAKSLLVSLIEDAIARKPFRKPIEESGILHRQPHGRKTPEKSH